MKNKQLIRFVNSLILLPILSISGPSFGNLPGKMPEMAGKAVEVAFLQRNDTLAQSSEADNSALVLAQKAEAIDTYFRERRMPLAGHGEKMVIEAEKNGLDWRLLAAIAVRESTGGKFKCQKATFSSFGWGSCKINFKSHDHEIETVAFNLGGNNPKTERYYAGKSVKGILQAYNPPSIVPRYAEQVISIMETIGPKEIAPADNTTA